MQDQEKQGAGRPRKTDRKQRINVTLSPDTLQALEESVPLKQRSALIEKLIRRELGLEAIV
jgi:metal-responsive CopG/Arc/MetJ family transcriptional regulator